MCNSRRRHIIKGPVYKRADNAHPFGMFPKPCDGIVAALRKRIAAQKPPTYMLGARTIQRRRERTKTARQGRRTTQSRTQTRVCAPPRRGGAQQGALRRGARRKARTPPRRLCRRRRTRRTRRHRSFEQPVLYARRRGEILYRSYAAARRKRARLL